MRRGGYVVNVDGDATEGAAYEDDTSDDGRRGAMGDEIVFLYESHDFFAAFERFFINVQFGAESRNKISGGSAFGDGDVTVELFFENLAGFCHGHGANVEH